jgi:hypothetical protein
MSGYSRAFQHITMQLGIPTYYCAGVTEGGYMSTVAENLGLSNYRMSLQFSINELPDGHIILIQHNNLIPR